MNARKWQRVALALCAILFAGFPALAIDPARTAPPFDLPLMDGSGRVRSDELFSKRVYTFLVFWQSSCEHCVESLIGCERFYRMYGGDDIVAIGINTDDRDRLAAREAIEANGITFPQALDPGGASSAGYGIPFGAFALCLVGQGGALLAVQIEPEDDAAAAMEKMLREGEIAPAQEEILSERGVPRQPAAAAASDEEVRSFSYHGLQRIRLLAIDTRGDDAMGLYGEAVNPQRSVQYRLEIEGAMKLAKNLRAGGLLRISNEGSTVLASGPEYIGSEWGSAFAEFEDAGLRVRVGYYRLSMTPFTLMRWDWNDSPHVGGDVGCGSCVGSAGALVVESLDELEPDLTFEGALASYGAYGFEARAFYAMPRRKIETSYSAHRFGGQERARYSQEIAGIEWRWQRLDARTKSLWKAGAHAIASFENKRSVDFKELDYSSADPWVSTRTLSFTAEAPIVRYVRLRGEYIAWNDTKEQGLLVFVNNAFKLVDEYHSGNGGFGGIAIEKPLGPSLLIDYLSLSSGFFTPFSALSYEPDAEGIRASARMPLLDDRFSLSLFHKRMHETELVAPETDRRQLSFSGASLDLGLWANLGAGLGWLEKKSWRDGGIELFASYRRGIAAEISYEFERAGAFRFRYERIKSVESDPNTSTRSDADMYSLYSSLEF